MDKQVVFGGSGALGAGIVRRLMARAQTIDAMACARSINSWKEKKVGVN